MRKIIIAAGARPNFIKIAPLHREFKKFPDIEHRIVHTGQHYDDNMSKVFFQDLELPLPDLNLDVGSGSHAEQIGKIMIKFEKVVADEKPDLVVVVGDVNSTLACALVAAESQRRVAHVEAGLRSFDQTMPEEHNRKLTDAISDFLFVTEPVGVQNLLREGVEEKKIFLVGDVMIDSLLHFRGKARASTILKNLGLTSKKFCLATIHRPSNVDVKQNLEKIFHFLEILATRTAIVFPVHPRTRKMLEHFDLMKQAAEIKNLVLLDPVGYVDFLSLLDNAALVLTDSGGIQAETTFLGVPCLTLRGMTEQPITVEEGTNELVGLDIERVLARSLEILEGKGKKGRVPDLWDGKAAERIVTILRDHIN